MIVTFFGHSDYRVNKEDEKRLLSLLEETVNGEDVEFFLGGYGGFDNFAYNCAKKYKSAHKNAELIYITPYLDRAPSIEYDSTLYPAIETVPKRFAISHRNKWMVDKADVVICYVNRSFGGACQFYQYAKGKNKSVYNLAE